MKISLDKFEFKLCTVEDLNRILEIQDQAFLYLESASLLRKNTKEMLRECLLPPNITLGAWHGDRLVAFSVLYFPEDETESLAKELEGMPVANLKAANYKLCIVDKDYRGNALQYTLGKGLVQYARNAKVELLCVTASPDNAHSISNIEKLGFVYHKTLHKYGYVRNLYYKTL